MALALLFRHRMRFSLALLACLSLTAACATELQVHHDQQAVVDGTPDGVGLLGFLNDPATTFESLDARLDRRAAQNLISGRPFATVDEVDAVKYVGNATLSKLVLMATELGYVPEGSDVLGSFDGVSFTVDQAERALDIVNSASDLALHDEVGLASRAVHSILEARPVVSMPVLAQLYWVGPKGLEDLRDYADLSVPASSERADCLSDDDCATGEDCGGFVGDGSTDLGKCHEVANLPGYWDECDDNTPCQAGLFCSGQTWASNGWCSPQWMQDTFYDQQPSAIPADEASATSSVVVYGQASVPMDIVVDLDLSCAHPEDLRITLLDPNGADAVIWDGPNEAGAALPSSFIALGNISRDDQVNGRWQLELSNLGGAGVGELHSWQLWISSRYD